ncbi:hypothetical protein EV182_007693 [Spiromyces aspiralis]|uniref:Uncharacterized protein n=1 Tax=Spiromyces aspiralis TaxID=68401 RepID=A0ACC1HCZ1_9FUNG|nr:hypothetical protein EV182_007693 [Spiromyces aspiralis]
MCLVLVALYNNDIIDAKKRLQEFGAEGVSGLGFNHSSREYDASQKLLDAYNNSEPDELQGALAEIGVLVPYPSIFQLAVKIRARGMDKKPQRQHPAPPIISPGESYGSQGHGEEEASDDDELL